MTTHYFCKSCGSLQEHTTGFHSKQSLDSSPPNAGGEATCNECGGRHNYDRQDLIWKQDKSPYHEQWEPGLTELSLTQFFRVVDELAPTVRDECMMLAFMTVVDPQTAVENVSVRDRIGDIIEPVNYRIFKEKCEALADSKPETEIVNQVIRDVLDYLFPRTDCTRLPQIEANHRSLIERCKNEMASATNDWQREQMQELIDQSLDWINNAGIQVDRDVHLYETFCYEVLRPLLSKNGE